MPCTAQPPRACNAVSPPMIVTIAIVLITKLKTHRFEFSCCSLKSTAPPPSRCVQSSVLCCMATGPENQHNIIIRHYPHSHTSQSWTKLSHPLSFPETFQHGDYTEEAIAPSISMPSTGSDRSVIPRAFKRMQFRTGLLSVVQEGCCRWRGQHRPGNARGGG